MAVIKRIIILILALAFRLSDRLRGLFRADSPLGTCVVLMYHDVSLDHLHRFVRQMEMLQLKAIPVPADSIRALKRGKHYVAVTFDDGFASTIEKVQPVLTQKGIPATYFIPTNYLGKAATWITDSRRRNDVGSIIDADSLRQLGLHSNVTVGSHGVNHQRLAEMEFSQVKKELAESKRALESIIGKDVTVLSFPFGDYNGGYVKLAYEEGYGRVFTVNPTLEYGTGEEFVTGRIQVDPTDWPLEFRLKILGSYRWLPIAYALKRGTLSLFRHNLSSASETDHCL